MSLVPQIRSRLRALFRKRRLDRDMAEEMAAHLEQRVQQNMRAGLSPHEARVAALRAFGPVLQIQEQCRDQRGWVLAEQIGCDLAYAVRCLRKSPGFTAVALVTLGLGIGANTAIFSLVKAVLLRPLPYPHPEELVAVWETDHTVDVASFSWSDFQDYRQLNRSFTALAGYRVVTYAMTGDGEPEQFTAAQVSADLLSTIGLAPQIGRFFTPAEDNGGAAGTIVLSDALWKRRFGADPRVVGRRFWLDQMVFTVIGVLPPEFSTPANADFLTPLGRASINPGWDSRTMRPGIFAIGRLKPGVSWRQARADLARVAALLERAHPEANSGVTASGQLLFEQTVGGYRRGLWLLFGAVGLVLLIACANLANLLLARGANRKAEIAVRTALGASQSRIVSQCLAESLVLGLGGGVLGLLLTLGARRGIAALSPAGVARFQQAEIDSGVLAAALVFSLLTALLFGAWPAWRMAQTELRPAMEGTGRGLSTGPGLARVPESLIIAEVAITLVLLMGAGLLLRSFARAQAVDLGFRTKGVLAARVKIPYHTYNTQGKSGRFHRALLARLAAIPGVHTAALSASIPLAPLGRYSSYFVDGLPQPSAGQTPAAEVNVVSDSYFATLGIPLLGGRTFGLEESFDSMPVAIVDRTFARRYWGEDEAIGKTIRLGGGPLTTIVTLPLAENRSAKFPIANDHFMIVGIVPPVRLYGYAAEPQCPQIYVSNRQIPLNTFLVLVQGRTDAAGLAGAVREAVHWADPNQPISEVRTLEDHLSATLAASRLYTFLLTIFAGLALLLAAVGLYGVLAYQVSNRQREFAIRLVLGGVASQITSLIVCRGLRLIAIGTALGTLAALALGRLFTALLFQTSAFDTGVIAGVACLLWFVALLASWLSSRRASRIAPSEALRAQ